MKFRIHYVAAGEEDSFIVSGDSFEEIRKVADGELAKRGGTDPRSEVLEGRMPQED